MDWRLAIVTLLPILISLVLLSACLKQPDKAALQVELHDAQERMQGTVVEYIHGMSVIKVFNRTLSAFSGMKGISTTYRGGGSDSPSQRQAHGRLPTLSSAHSLLFLLPAVLLLIPTAESYLDFLPVILLFFLVGSGLKEPMENLMQMVILSGRIVEGVNRIDNILRQPEPDQNGAGDPATFDVEFSDVEFAYTEGIPAVDHVSFHLPQGTVTAGGAFRRREIHLGPAFAAVLCAPGRHHPYWRRGHPGDPACTVDGTGGLCVPRLRAVYRYH